VGLLNFSTISEEQWADNQKLLELRENVDFYPIHTHDRINFKRCRRRWFFQSPLREHLRPKNEDSDALWFGSGFHFALEDYHGHTQYRDPIMAFLAYCEATNRLSRPMGWEYYRDMAIGMFNYYTKYWLPYRNFYETVWMFDKPLVEVRFRILIPELSDIAGKPIMYQGTFDRIVRDKRTGEIWVLDYKTAKAMSMLHIETDPQVNAYSWSAPIWLGLPVAGMLYQQHLKGFPAPPRELQRGGFSQDVKQNTTYRLYREALIQRYGKIPQEYVAFLNKLVVKEDENGDAYIRIHKAYRSEYQTLIEYQKILAEGKDMINEDLPLYPNPTRDCSWDCPFRAVCIAMDDDGDIDWLLREGYQEKDEEVDWRSRLPHATELMSDIIREGGE
jgi:hypothetical protein